MYWELGKQESGVTFYTVFPLMLFESCDHITPKLKITNSSSFLSPFIMKNIKTPSVSTQYYIKRKSEKQLQKGKTLYTEESKVNGRHLVGNNASKKTMEHLRWMGIKKFHQLIILFLEKYLSKPK